MTLLVQDALASYYVSPTGSDLNNGLTAAHPTPVAGWDFKSADVSSDSALHLTWRNAFGTVLYWDVTAGGTTKMHTYGPLLG